ncbi:MAG: Ppx/GppA phosphatase family protein [Lutibacter sp.]
MKIEKLAGIDIGSNAIRLLIVNVIHSNENATPLFKKSAIIRVPIRLGADTFLNEEISSSNVIRMINAMKAFQLLMDVHGVKKYKACATSAMREAKNGAEIVNKIKKESAIDIEIINGKKEAEIIFSTDLSSIIKNNASYLYVDVGGGSTEMTIFSKGNLINSKSFKIGTVRTLSKKNKNAIWDNIEKWIKENTIHLSSISLIGSGGNINKLFKMSGKQIGKPLSKIYLQSQYQFLKALSYDEKITELGLNPDRADVIVPALKIYLSAMKWSNAKKIYVPKIGLADGIVKSLYFENL